MEWGIVGKILIFSVFLVCDLILSLGFRGIGWERRIEFVYEFVIWYIFVSIL